MPPPPPPPPSLAPLRQCNDNKSNDVDLSPTTPGFHSESSSLLSASLLSAIKGKKLVKGPKLPSRREFMAKNEAEKAKASNLASSLNNLRVKSEEDWKASLTDNEFRVLRLKATDPKGVSMARGGFDDDFPDEGKYICAGCGADLYTHEMKFDCGCGWPGFWTNIKNAVYEQQDKDGHRFEIVCSACGGHLGHIFRGENHGNPAPDERHCVNSTSIAYVDGEGRVERCTYSGPLLS